jgi:hypothetical protein
VVAAAFAAEPEEIPMTTRKSKRQTPSRSNSGKTGGRSSPAQTTARKATKLKLARSPAVGQQQSLAEQMGRPESKRARIIAMLRAPGGATIEAMAHATEWKQHSIRGFLAGVIRKKLGLNLVSTAAEGGRVYRITDRTDLHVAAARASQAA